MVRCDHTHLPPASVSVHCMQTTDVLICEHETEVRAVDINLSAVFVASCSSNGQILVHEVRAYVTRTAISITAHPHAVR